jgi:hypothetical protein
MFLVNNEIRAYKFPFFHFPGAEMLEESVWHLLGDSFFNFMKQRLYMRTNNSAFNLMGT